MFLKYRKIFLIIGFTLLCLLLGFIIFYFFFRAKITVAPPTEIPTTTPPTTLPSIGEGQLPIPSGITTTPVPITTPQEITTPTVSSVANGGITMAPPVYEKPTYGATISPDGQDILTYDRTTGKFIRLTADGKIDYMSDKVFYDVEKVTWAPNKTEAILEYPDGSNISYNFKTKVQVTLPKHWEDFSYAPSGNKIAAKSIADDSEYNWLIESDSTGNNLKPIERIGDNYVNVYDNWSPNNQVIAMYVESKDFDRQKLYFVGQNNENFPLTIIEGRDFEGIWSETGDKLLYSVYNSASDFKPIIWTVTTSSEDMSQYRKKLNVNTWAEKCYFQDNDNIYCAVPESLPEGSGIYPEVADNIPDNIYKINVSTGAKQFIARPENNSTIGQLFVSEDGSYLYYQDKNTGFLHKIMLK